jgi:glycosyltransferase involved in cell wall biosynthesis
MMSGMNSVTGVLRLSNEEEWLPKCLESILDIFDEILLCTQGVQKDNTIEICKAWSSKHDKAKYCHYEYESRPNGPGHNKQPYDKYSRAYFYNWCFNKASCEWVCKWDGDMIAMDTCKNWFKKAIENNACLSFPGVDVVKDVYHIGDREFCAAEVRLYKKANYINGANSEAIDRGTLHPHKIMKTNEPLFIHTKWAKSEYAQTQAWPKGWKNNPHFKKIYERSIATKLHNRKLPKCLTQTTV